MNVLVIGGGAQGSAAAFDLLRHPAVERVVVADLVVGAPDFLRPHVGPRLELIALDARDRVRARTAMEGMDAVLCALALAFEPGPKWPLLLVPLQRVVYRPLLYWFALRSVLCIMRGTHPGWQKPTRHGTATMLTASALAVGLLLSPSLARADRPPLLRPTPATTAAA